MSTILLQTGNFWITEEQKNIEVTDVYYSDTNLFNVFTLKFISGNPKTCLSSTDNVVITEQTATNLFGSENPIGKTIKRDDEKAYVVSAVIENIPTNSHLKFNMLLSINERKPQWDGRNGNHNASIYVLLEKGVKASDLPAGLRQFTNKHIVHSPDKCDLQLQSLSDLHLNSRHTMWEMNKNKFDKSYVLVLVLIAFLLLAIVAINFFNLTLVGLSKRKTEIGIKKVNGSGRIQIISQLLFESLILAGLACVFAVLIVLYSYPYLKTNFLIGYAFNDIFNLGTATICLGVVLVMVLLTGLLPSFSYSSLSPISMLSGNISKKFSRKSFNQNPGYFSISCHHFFDYCHHGNNQANEVCQG